MTIETTSLYKEMLRRATNVPDGPRDLPGEFERLRTILQEHGKYIVLLFPEYTPHDHSRHLDHLFVLADRVLGQPLYDRLAPSELVLLAYGLFAHDWGMAVSESEKKCLISASTQHEFALLPDEPARAQHFMSTAMEAGRSPEVAWRDYLRDTHGLRSGARLRKHLVSLGAVFADAVAKIAEGHTLTLREVRDTNRFPLSLSVFGETVNVAALTTYVRMIDLLDIGDDRTPYALWKFVAPADSVSSMEWRKHRALSPVSVRQGSKLRELIVSGHTDDHAVFAALADLQSWVNDQFAMSMAQLRTISGKYDLDLDSRILWQIDASGFEPLIVRFELGRAEVLGLLSRELYQNDPLVFLRELLQNSIDAIDARTSLLAQHGLTFTGEVRVNITSTEGGLRITWTDNGIGMDEDILSSFFANLGRSWYRSPEARRLGEIEAISQFGVGILSCFAVSDKLTIETMRDPHAFGTQPSLVVEIPTRESHFRIQRTTSVTVGTSIHLEIPKSQIQTLSMEAVTASLFRIARYVKHNVAINSNGLVTNSGFPAMTSKNATANQGPELAITSIGMRGDSAESISSLTSQVSFEFGDPSGDYQGHYVAIMPKKPSEARTTADSSVWYLGETKIDLDDVLVETEQTLFAKGIQTGPVSMQRNRVNDDSNHIPNVRYSRWIRPKILLNILRPRDLQFDLSRSSVNFVSNDRLRPIWQDIALKLRASAFPNPVDNVASNALLLGSCATYGAIPDIGLYALVEQKETPLLVLRAGEGPVWLELDGFVGSTEFIQAPFELAYAFAGTEFPGFGVQSGLHGWKGEDALFPSRGFSSHRFPWLDSVLAFGERVLLQQGWRPVEIRLVNSPVTETLPLVCCVWKNLGIEHDDYINYLPKLRAHPKQTTSPAAMSLVSFYKEAPQLLRFPTCVANYGAFGSRYWNIEHPKIVRIVAALTALFDRQHHQKLSTESSRVVSYVISNTFYGYVVPSRYSSPVLAIEVPNRLLQVAEVEGLIGGERLCLDDFFPGSVGSYKNPYRYEIQAWENGAIGLGRPWNPNHKA